MTADQNKSQKKPIVDTEYGCGDTNMTVDHIKPEDFEWRCFHCDQQLEVGSIIAEYLKSNITTVLPQCPTCHMVIISEELALGKIAEVEKLLEEK